MEFWKYSAAGNDFILLSANFRRELSSKVMQQLCDRKFGIGADGILFVAESESTDHFIMNYINADGGEVEMCGNGARACVHWFAKKNNKTVVSFTTFSGAHYQARVLGKDSAEVTMNEFKDASLIEVKDFLDVAEASYMNTGVPHSIFLLKDEQSLDDEYWMQEAVRIRHDKRFINGCNVNFVKKLSNNEVRVRTFERGVEGETLACGTGVVAVARLLQQDNLKVHVLGGELQVRFDNDNCWLTGPVVEVFKGEVNLSVWR